MNDVSHKRKDSILKTLAIAGFIGIIILIAWLAIQLVNVMPGAFSSLASLAEGVNQYQESILSNEERPVELTVTSDSTLVNTESDVTLSWETTEMNGSYTFSYQCADGVAVDIRSVEGLQTVACGTNYNIGNVGSLSLMVASEEERYADLRYTIAFLATNDREPRASGTAVVTILNTNILDTIGEGAIVSEEVMLETPEETAPEPVTEPEPMVDTTPNTPTTPPTPVYEQEFVYEIPVSNPNGRTDLAVRFIAVGNITENTFTPGTIRAAEGGAIQFEVKNYGTKTSDEWEFSVSLPNGGTYSADDQTPLKPNERAVLTIGFAPSTARVHTFDVIVDTPSDSNALNDGFSHTVSLN